MKVLLQIKFIRKPQDITTLSVNPGTGVSDVVNRANTLTTTITDVITNGPTALAAPENRRT